MLECGEKCGSCLIITEEKISNLFLKLEKEPLSVKKAYNHPNILDLVKCSSASCPLPSKTSTSPASPKSTSTKHFEYSGYLASDPFTNNILINWYLSDEVAIPNISNMFMSWICNDEGYNLYDHLDISNINNFQDFPNLLTINGKPSPTAKADDKSPIQRDVIVGIITQLFAILHNLRKYDFSHGNPSTNCLKFKKESVSYIHDGYHVKSPITLKLENFSNSGCTVLESKIRLYSTSVIAEEQLKKKNFEFIIETSNDNNIITYKLKDPNKYLKSSLLFMYLKHLGLPVYSSSFDAYAFMIVLLCERAFYSTVMSDKVLSNFVKKMWINESDFQKVINKIISYHEKFSSVETPDVLRILSDVSLQCDMIDFGWNMIKSL